MQTEEQTINNDFDEFSSPWTPEEADAFDAALADMRRVGPADWGPLSQLIRLSNLALWR